MNFGDHTIFKKFKLHSTTDKIKQICYLLPLYLFWIYKTKAQMVKYIQKEIKFHFFLKKKNEWKKILKNTTAKWLDYIMFWKKIWNLSFFRCLFANKTDYNVLFLQATRKTSSYRIKIKTYTPRFISRSFLINIFPFC